MIIKNITINSFGKFHNYSLDLNDGVNVVYGENEYGKSTIMAFIKLVFYGQFKSNGIGSKDLREKYAPWDGMKMSGSITIEYSGEIYKIQKEISDKSRSYDKTVIYNLSRGETITLKKNEEVGEYFLGVDASGFERSSYIKNIGGIDFIQASNAKKVSKDTVFDKILSNLAGGGEEEFSQSEVVSRVEVAKNRLRTPKGKGEIFELEKAIENLELKINGLKDFEKSQEVEKAKLKKLENLINEQRALSKAAEKVNNYKRANEIKDLIDTISNWEKLGIKISEKGVNPALHREVLGVLEKYDDELNANGVNIRHYKDLAEKRDKDFVKITQEEEDLLKEQIRICNESGNMAKYFDNVKSAMDELRCLREKKSGERDREKLQFARKRNGVLVSAFISFMFFVLMFLFNFVIPSVIFVGVLLCSVFFYFCLRRKFNQYQEVFLVEIRDIDKKIEDLNSKLIFEAANGNSESDYKTAHERIEFLLNEKRCGDYSDFYQNRALTKELERYEKILNEYLNERREVLKKLELYLTEHNIDTDLKKFDECLDFLRNYSEKYDELEEQIKYKSQVLGLGGIGKEGLKNILKSLSDEGCVEIDEEKMRGLTERLGELNRMNLYDAYKETSEKILNSPEDLGALEMQLKKMNSRKAGMKYYYACLEIAGEVFDKAVAEMRYNFSPKLNERASEIFRALTSGKYEYMRVNKDYEFVVGDKNIDRASENFSSGTIDQAYLSLRIAVSELILPERAPLLFDDTLMQYDDVRLKEVMNFLRNYALKNGVQSIVFTCHKAVSESLVS